jgi:hypothetical protein
VQLQELDHVAADPAPEAVEEPLVAGHLKGGRLLGVKGTQPLVIGAQLLQRDVVLDHDDDIRVKLEVVDERLREERHQSFSSTTVTPPPP